MAVLSGDCPLRQAPKAKEIDGRGLVQFPKTRHIHVPVGVGVDDSEPVALAFALGRFVLGAGLTSLSGCDRLDEAGPKGLVDFGCWESEDDMVVSICCCCCGECRSTEAS
jgi:hypothetical protein